MGNLEKVECQSLPQPQRPNDGDFGEDQGEGRALGFGWGCALEYSNAARVNVLYPRLVG